MILPAGPLPLTFARSTPSSLARLRTAGLASGLLFPPLVAGAGGVTVFAFVFFSGSGFESSTTGSGSASSAEFPSPSTSKVMHVCPTGRMSPTPPLRVLTVPSTGLGIVTVALSVMTSRTGSSSLTVAPTSTCQATTSPSTTPSPISGSLNEYIPMFRPLVFSLLLQLFFLDWAYNPIQWYEGMACPNL